MQTNKSHTLFQVHIYANSPHSWFSTHIQVHNMSHITRTGAQVHTCITQIAWNFPKWNMIWKVFAWESQTKPSFASCAHCKATTIDFFVVCAHCRVVKWHHRKVRSNFSNLFTFSFGMYLHNRMCFLVGDIMFTTKWIVFLIFLLLRIQIYYLSPFSLVVISKIWLGGKHMADGALSSQGTIDDWADLVVFVLFFGGPLGAKIEAMSSRLPFLYFCQ